MCEKLRAFAVVLVAVLLRWCVSYHPYSGQGKPPIFGDYEAQRHWQEITLNLPVEQWYTNSTDNDLQYWGLDYPPLSAYHSLLVAHVANGTNPDFVKLHESRGYESDAHKYFMRLSTLQSDLLTYVPAVLCFVTQLKVRDRRSLEADELNIFGFGKRDFILAAILTYPGLMLIDYGHFQYNCVSLGLFVASVTAILRNMPLVASFLFVLAFNYKQMELYHALPFFFYILGSNVPDKLKPLKYCVTKLAYVALTVILTFSIVWAPLMQDRNTFLDAISRLFPLARGVFEDKVSNVWCAINLIHKLRNTFSNIEMAKVCLVATLTTLLPSCLDLFFRPSKEKFIISLVNTALAFFLFSFQVHEKSILLVAVPVLMYFPEDPLPCFWFLLISSFSMLPLLIKDGLFLAYVATTAFYTISVCWMFLDMFKMPFESDRSDTKVQIQRSKGSIFDHDESGSNVSTESNSRTSIVSAESNSRTSITSATESISETDLKSIVPVNGYYLLIMGLFYISMLGTLLLTLGIAFMRPPRRYPDIWPVLVSVYSCGHFLLFFIYFNYKQFCISSSNSNEKLKAN